MDAEETFFSNSNCYCFLEWQIKHDDDDNDDDNDDGMFSVRHYSFFFILI